MVNHGRLARVMLALMVAMTVGAMILLVLEGKPIKPMDFSLSSQIHQRHLKPVHETLGTQAGITLGRWQYIEVCYRHNDNQLSNGHLVGSLAKDFHFVISDGSSGQDGQIYATNRWTGQLPCLSALNTLRGRQTIRICLIGDPSRQVSTPNQSRQLGKLVSSLARHCQIDANISWTTR